MSNRPLLQRDWLAHLAQTVQTDECIDYPWTPTRRYNEVFIPGKGQQAAHRVVYEMFAGHPIPDGLHIRHLCGWSRCVNPRHMVPGTIMENQDDRVVHGTSWRGELSPNARLTEAIVHEVRASTEPTKALARRYGVHPRTISDVRRGRSWKHVKEQRPAA